MNTKQLGWTDLALSRIGLGTWAMGGGDWTFSMGPQDDELSIKTIHQALDQGINWLDTAAMYGLGHAERVIGRAIAGMSSRPYIATKCSRLWTEEGEIYGSLQRDSILAEAEASLDRLGVDVIDLYQIHWPLPDEAIEEGWRALEELISSGKIRYGGVSNFNVPQMQRAQAIHPIASLQPSYSMLKREIEQEILPFCAENDIGVIIYSPMKKGLLTGKVDHAYVESLPEDDHRKRDPRFNDPRLSINLKLLDGLAEIAQAAGRSLPQLAIAWTLQRPQVTAAIVGARRPDQIKETAQAADWDLSPAQLEKIERLLEQRKERIAQAEGG